MRRGKTHFVSVSSEADQEEIICKAMTKHASFDQKFDETLAYLLLYPDFREVRHIPGTTELFKLSKYKQAIANDYKRLTFHLISLDDMEECKSDGETTDWSRLGFLRTDNATTTRVSPKTKDDDSDAVHSAAMPTQIVRLDLLLLVHQLVRINMLTCYHT